ncbi:response regulator transcription factor [Rheinheimera aquimaris]|uniref:Response regulator transcription factor n=1 Tax=Rheinheimera aquimaris TaxID=412437 RepID=A0ABP3NML1_9GAMM|nr:response regulator transcription factor [Rheinheimera aquimaris]MCB5213070.1 response regulator transcription factor [Rheinheimera aquimaris]
MIKSMPGVKQPIVYILDDDPAVRDSLSSLLRSVGLQASVFASVTEFQQTSLAAVPSCLILDVRLQFANGLDFHRQLVAEGIDLPVIFITGHGDIPMTVKAMKSGAVDFLAKPFREQDLLDAIALALQKAEQRLAASSVSDALRNCFASLTNREQQVMRMAVSGLLNKQIADQLNLSLITVKIHRGNMMKKMQARNFAELVRMAEQLSLNKA